MLVDNVVMSLLLLSSVGAAYSSVFGREHVVPSGLKKEGILLCYYYQHVAPTELRRSENGSE
jgi:hypothetical protein